MLPIDFVTKSGKPSQLSNKRESYPIIINMLKYRMLSNID